MLFKKVKFENIHNHDFESVKSFLKRAPELKELTLKQSIANQELLLTVALQNCKELKTIRIWSKVTKDLALVMLQHGNQIENLDLAKNLT